jgi:hypothetical protein
MSSILADLVPDRLYVFALGPGFGESVLLRVPPNYWIVIDSFRMRNSPAAQYVLDRYSAEADLLILTHPHDDHVCGFVDLIDRNKDSQIGFVNLREIGKAQQVSNDPLSKFCNNAKKTYDRIHQEQQNNKGRFRNTLRGQVFQIPDGRIESLHPSLQIPNEYLQSCGCNELSSPMLLEWHQLRLLLGADLTNEHGHWDEIGASYPTVGHHTAAKIPHHASRESLCHSFGNGSPGRCWVATPYNRGRKKLPRFDTKQGVELILASYVDELNVTSLPYRHVEELQSPLVIQRNVVASGTPALSPNRPVADELERGIVLGFDMNGTIMERRYGRGTLRISE